MVVSAFFGLFHWFILEVSSKSSKILKFRIFNKSLENIKKIWEHSKNPKAASPLRVQGDDTETILRILNDEVLFRIVVSTQQHAMSTDQ